MGDAQKGAKEFSVDGLNGGTGVPFRSEDEAAFAWALENMQYTTSGQYEHAATIYSQKGKSGKTFSYNGSFTKYSTTSSDPNRTQIPTGATIEGFIHTHDHEDEFSYRTNSPADPNRQRPMDRDDMADNTDDDYYLLNPHQDLIVNRRIVRNTYDDNRDGAESDQILVSGIGAKGMHFYFPLWLTADRTQYQPGGRPPFVVQWLQQQQQKK
jgi:hypothetical protein